VREAEQCGVASEPAEGDDHRSEPERLVVGMRHDGEHAAPKFETPGHFVEPCSQMLTVWSTTR
jgi:hypothetical protein